MTNWPLAVDDPSALSCHDAERTIPEQRADGDGLAVDEHVRGEGPLAFTTCPR